MAGHQTEQNSGQSSHWTRWTPLEILGIVGWIILTGVLILWTAKTGEIGNNQLAYLGVIVPAVAYGILALVAGVILVDVFTPFLDFHQLFSGDGQSKIAGSIILTGILMSVALIIYGAN